MDGVETWLPYIGREWISHTVFVSKGKLTSSIKLWWHVPSVEYNATSIVESRQVPHSPSVPVDSTDDVEGQLPLSTLWIEGISPVEEHLQLCAVGA